MHELPIGYPTSRGVVGGGGAVRLDAVTESETDVALSNLMNHGTGPDGTYGWAEGYPGV